MQDDRLETPPPTDSDVRPASPSPPPDTPTDSEATAPAADPPTFRSRLRPFLYPLKVLVALGLLWWVFDQYPPRDLLAEFAHVDPLMLALAFALVPVKLALEARRWYLLVRLIDPSATMRRALASLLVGSSAALLTPGGFGHHLRITFFPGASKTRLAAVSMFDWYAHGAVVSLAGITALCVLPLGPYLDAPEVPRWATATIVAVILFAICSETLSFMIAVTPKTVLRVVARVPWIERRHLFQEVRTALHLVDRRTRLMLLVWSLCTFVVYIAQFIIVLRGMGFSHHLTWAAITASLLVRRALPISVGGFGVREISMKFALRPLGAAPAVAINAALVSFVLNLLIPALMGLAVIAGMRMRPARPTASTSSTGDACDING